MVEFKSRTNRKKVLSILTVILVCNIVLSIDIAIAKVDHYLSVDIGDWVEYNVEQANDEAWAFYDVWNVLDFNYDFDEIPNDKKVKLNEGYTLRFEVVDKVFTSSSSDTLYSRTEQAVCDIFVNNIKVKQNAFLTFDLYFVFRPFTPNGASYWMELEESLDGAGEIRIEGDKVFFAEWPFWDIYGRDSGVSFEDKDGRWSTYDKDSGVLLEYRYEYLSEDILTLEAVDSSVILGIEGKSGVEWWRWAMVAVAIVSGTIFLWFYYAKRHKR